MLKIVQVPNEILTTPVKPIVEFDEKLQETIKNMEKVLNDQIDPQGVGLAATQVGLSQAIFIIKPSAKSKPATFINPKIIKLVNSLTRNKKTNKHTKKKPTKLEGCLSIPRVWGPIKRANKILLEYQLLNGKKKTEWFSGFNATIIQHEVDHLNGILFTQRSLEQKGRLYEEKEGKLEKLEY